MSIRLTKYGIAELLDGALTPRGSRPYAYGVRSSKASAASACALAAVAAAGAYWGTLDNGFTWDDHVHIEAAPFVQDARNARAFLTRDFWTASSDVEGRARPLLLASLLVDRALWGAEPGGYHATSLLLHASCAAALAWLIWLLLESALIAAFGGMLFALHPVQTEAVCAATFRADLLAALGVLLALAALRLACARRSRAWAAAAAAFFFLGLLSKESAVVFPALAAMAEFFFPSGHAARSARRTAGALIATVFVVYAVFRLQHGDYEPPVVAPWSVPAAETQGAVQFDQSPPEWKEAFRDPKTRILTMSGVFGDYARLALWPVGLQADRSAPVISSWLSLRAWMGWITLFLVLAAARLARTTMPAAAFGLCWFVAALAPVSGAIILPNLIAERYLYLALAGAALAAAAGLDAAVKLCPRPRPTFLAVSAALLAIAAIATRGRVPAWRDDAALFGGTLVTDSSRLRYNRAQIAENLGHTEEASIEYRKALALNPSSVEALVNLAEIERSRGRARERLALLRQAVSVAPRSSIAWESLGHALEAAGRSAEALEAYQKAVGVDSRRAHARRSLALAYARGERYEEALKEAALAVKLEPTWAAAHYERGRIAQEAKRLDVAAAAFREAARFDPKNGLAWANLGVCLHQTGNTRAALAPTKQATKVLPRNPAIWRNLGSVLNDLGRLEEAEIAYEAAVRLEPEFAGAWYDYGVVLQKRRLFARAADAYAESLRLYPESVRPMANLALLRARAGEFEAALALMERAVKLSDDPQLRAAYNEILRLRAAARR